MIQLRISGKDLGAVSRPTFCPRCFWVQRRAPSGLPGSLSGRPAKSLASLLREVDADRSGIFWG